MISQRRIRIVTALKKARAMIARPGGWCRYTYAKDKDGKDIVSLLSTYAEIKPHIVQVCALGAIDYVSLNYKEYCLLQDFLDRTTKRLYPRTSRVEEVNDSHKTPRPVLRIYDETIRGLWGDKP